MEIPIHAEIRTHHGQLRIGRCRERRVWSSLNRNALFNFLEPTGSRRISIHSTDVHCRLVGHLLSLAVSLSEATDIITDGPPMKRTREEAICWTRVRRVCRGFMLTHYTRRVW